LRSRGDRRMSVPMDSIYWVVSRHCNQRTPRPRSRSSCARETSGGRRRADAHRDASVCRGCDAAAAWESRL